MKKPKVSLDPACNYKISQIMRQSWSRGQLQGHYNLLTSGEGSPHINSWYNLVQDYWEWWAPRAIISLAPAIRFFNSYIYMYLHECYQQLKYMDLATYSYS